METGDDADGLADGPGLLSMPAEILEHIWLSSQLDHCDVCHLAMTCSKFRHISNSNEVWKQKLNNRWSGLLLRYPRTEQHVWKDEFRKRGEIGRATRSKISGMSQLYIHKEEVPKSGFQVLGCTDDPETARFIIDVLMEMFHDKEIHKNLTEKYYAEKALCHVHQLHIQGEWRRFLSQPVEKQHLEKGAVLIAQWCQPTLNITATSVAISLDTTALQVLTEVARRHPEHPINKKNPDDLMTTEVSTSPWTPKQSYQILECLNYVLFTNLNFTGNADDYYDPLNSYINMVLVRKKGIPISLCLVYSSVARRLHVLCEPVNFPTHFLLRWLEHPGLEDGQDYTYIDVFHKGKFLTEFECSNLLDIHISEADSHSNCEAISPIKVFERMARNLVNIGQRQGQMGDGLMCLRNAVELLLTICPDEMDARILQARLYLHLNINLREVIDILQGLSAVDRNAPTGLIGYLMLTAGQQLAEQNNEPEHREIIAKNRSEAPEVELSIGLIAKHKRYNYTCVIYGWDAECEATQEWITQMGVNNLTKQKYQPFYNVLVEDGSNRYAAQAWVCESNHCALVVPCAPSLENCQCRYMGPQGQIQGGCLRGLKNLELAPEPKVITHPEVGRYFQEFCGTHYVPNAEKLTQYPDDLSTTLRYTAAKYE